MNLYRTLCLIILILLTASLSFSASETVFSDGFEDGDLSEWSSVNSGDNAASDSFAFEGNYYASVVDCDTCDSWGSGGQIVRTLSSSKKPDNITFAAAYDKTTYNSFRLYFTDSSASSHVGYVRLIRDYQGGNFWVNGNDYSAVSDKIWVDVKLANIDYETATIGAIYRDGSKADSSVSFSSSDADEVDKILLSADDAGTGSRVYLDAIKFEKEIQKPNFHEISYTPENWSRNQAVDLEVNASSPQGVLSSVSATVYHNGENITSEKLENSSGLWKAQDLFSVENPGYYNISINATDSDGKFNINHLNKSTENVSLSWSHSGSPEGYKVYSNATGGMEKVADVSSMSYEHVSTAISSGKYVCYEITAFNQYGESEPVQSCKNLF